MASISKEDIFSVFELLNTVVTNLEDRKTVSNMVANGKSASTSSSSSSSPSDDPADGQVECLMTSVDTSSMTRRKFTKKQLKQIVMAVMHEFFLKVKSIFGSMEPDWNQLFYNRMIHREDVLSAKQIDQYIDAFEFYDGLIAKKKEFQGDVPLLNSLLEHIHRHYQDPDNSLIGLKPRMSFIHNHYEKTADGISYKPKIPHSQHHASSAVAMHPSTKSYRASTKKLSCGTNFRLGDLVIFLTDPTEPPSLENSIYVRIVKVDETGQFVKVAVNPLETIKRMASLDHVLELHPYIVEALGVTRSMQKLVDDPIDDLFAKMTESIKERLANYLRSNLSINMELLLTLPDGATIDNLPEINQMHRIFQRVKASPPEEFYNSIEVTAKNTLQQFSDHPPHGIFVPNKKKSINDFMKLSFSQIARNRLNLYIGNVESALDLLKLQKRLLMNGTRKAELTSWWLNYIDRICAHMLQTTTTFNLSAIIDDYIDQPPPDMQAIKENLVVIERLLKFKDERLKPFVEEQKQIIYKEINRFTHQATIVLAEQFELALAIFSLDLARSTFEQQKASMSDEKVKKWIDEMIKDIEYLEEMKEMERLQEEREKESANSSTPSSGSPLVLSKVVPVSGLILNYFYRMENVLRTIIELWDHKTKPPPPPPSPSSSPSPSPSLSPSPSSSPSPAASPSPVPKNIVAKPPLEVPLAPTVPQRRKSQRVNSVPNLTLEMGTRISQMEEQIANTLAVKKVQQEKLAANTTKPPPERQGSLPNMNPHAPGKSQGHSTDQPKPLILPPVPHKPDQYLPHNPSGLGSQERSAPNPAFLPPVPHRPDHDRLHPSPQVPSVPPKPEQYLPHERSTLPPPVPLKNTQHSSMSSVHAPHSSSSSSSSSAESQAPGKTLASFGKTSSVAMMPTNSFGTKPTTGLPAPPVQGRPGQRTTITRTGTAKTQGSANFLSYRPAPSSAPASSGASSTNANPPRQKPTFTAGAPKAPPRSAATVESSVIRTARETISSTDSRNFLHNSKAGDLAHSTPPSRPRSRAIPPLLKLDDPSDLGPTPIPTLSSSSPTTPERPDEEEAPVEVIRGPKIREKIVMTKRPLPPVPDAPS